VAGALNRLRQWFTRRPRAAPPSVPRTPPAVLLQRYGHYKDLLTANSAVLSILADLQTKMNEGFLFDMHYVRSACGRLGQEVEGAVRSLIAMAGGRYGALETARQAVAQKVLEELAGAEMRPVLLALPLAQVTEGQFFGGKAEKLAEVARLGLPVPSGFAVSAYAQKVFFEEAGLEEFIRQAVTRANIRDLDSLRQAGAAIQARILAAPLPPELSRALAEQLEVLGSGRVSVRSSALQEDSLVSFAGQFETALNVPLNQVEQRYKEVIASQFTPRALYYCHASGFSYQELAMGVLVMKMVESRAAGVLYTADPRQGEAVTIINAVWGLGSVAVGGHAEPDVYRVQGDQLISQMVGDKAQMHICVPEGGVLETDTPAQMKGPSLKEPQVLKLAALGGTVEKHFGFPQDIEWALGPGGNFYLLQARPLRVGRHLKAEYLPPRLKGAEVLLENGIIASRGAAAGPVHLLEGEDVTEVPQGTVLVARRALPEYGLAADRVAAVVCEMGSATSHLATVLREAGTPAIFGAKGATTLLSPGAMVTVDAYYGNIYAGRQEEMLKAPQPDLILRQSRAWKMLERVLKYITPLNLLDPRAENFRPEYCRTYHDITRFAHEQAMSELFEFSQALPEEGARQLKANVPVEIYVIDLGGGLRPEAAAREVVLPEDLQSRPMVAYWRGVSAIGWKGPKPLDLAGFMSVIMGSATGPNVQERLIEKNYAIIAADYLNFSSRLGYHFATIDAYLGTLEDSYVTFTFYGGGAELTRRIRRVQFMSKVLQYLDFRVELKGDSLTARLDGYDPSILEEKLEVLGRLIMVSKQLDVTMETDALVEHYYQEFVHGGYDLRI
jgi:pyruvate,water dikinase